MRRLLLAVIGAAAGRSAYRLLAGGAVAIDLGIGRRVRELGPVSFEIAGEREIVFGTFPVPPQGGDVMRQVRSAEVAGPRRRQARPAIPIRSRADAACGAGTDR